MAQVLDDEGMPVIGHRIRLRGASGIKTDEMIRSGQWVRITVQGVAHERAYDPQSKGTVREITIQASQENATVELIETPPDIPGQQKLGEEAGEPDPKGKGKAVRDDAGNVVTGPEE